MEDKGYEVVDKRNNNSQEEPETDQQEESTTEQEAGSEASQDEQAAGGEPADVYSLIGLSVMMLSESAWQWMGLRVNPGSGKVEKDLVQAKIAIDSIVFLSDKIAPHIGEADRKAMRDMISNLQINFVQQTGK